jgi:hypothetical protein
MQELKFSTTPTLKVIVDGVDYMVRKPSVGLVKEMEREQREKGDAAGYDAVLNAIEKCGLPRVMAESLPIEALNELIEALIPTKKKG